MSIKTAALLHQSVSSLLDDPLEEYKDSASFFLAMHCLMLALLAISLFDKYFFDLIAPIKAAWPIESTNPRNPLSAGGVLAILIGGPLYLFWSIIGRSRPEARIGLRHYHLITWSSAIFANIPLIFVAIELGFPEVSLAVGAANFAFWARWSMQKYSSLNRSTGSLSGAA